jgi:transcriptional regulator with XRE-family HTH domain
MSATSAGLDPLAVYSIGLKLRTLRAAKNLTLTRLSAQTGLSTALLSKLETDHMVPTLHTLEKICRVYGISFGHFFCEPQHHSLAITRKAHTTRRRGDQLPRPTPLHVPTAEGHQISQIIDIPAGVSTTVGECGSTTEVTAYVIEGTLHVSIAGANEILEQGDSLVVTTDQSLVWSAPDKTACRILSVATRPSPGQRAA